MRSISSSSFNSPFLTASLTFFSTLLGYICISPRHRRIFNVFRYCDKSDIQNLSQLKRRALSFRFVYHYHSLRRESLGRSAFENNEVQFFFVSSITWNYCHPLFLYREVYAYACTPTYPLRIGNGKHFTLYDQFASSGRTYISGAPGRPGKQK